MSTGRRDGFFVTLTGFGTLVVHRRRIRETRVIHPAARPAEVDQLGV